MKPKHPNIEELYNQYSQRLYFTSLRIVGNTFDAEEIMHDTFLKYHNFAPKEEIKEIKNWLTGICIRKSIDLLRSRNRLQNNIEEYTEQSSKEPFFSLPDSILEETEQEQTTLINKIKQSLNSLSDKYRTILSLHLFEGYDYSEIEEITGIKENNIRIIFMRGKAQLMELIK